MRSLAILLIVSIGFGAVFGKPKQEVDLSKLPIEVPSAPFPVASPEHFEARYLSGSSSYGYVTQDQYKVEIRRPDGGVEGVFGYKTPDGKSHVTSYVSDTRGYRIVKNDVMDKIAEEGATFHKLIMDQQRKQKPVAEPVPVVKEPKFKTGLPQHLANHPRSHIKHVDYSQSLQRAGADVAVDNKKEIGRTYPYNSQAFSGPIARAQAGEYGFAQALGGGTAIAGPGKIAVAVPKSIAKAGKGGSSVAAPDATAIAGPGGYAIANPYAFASVAGGIWKDLETRNNPAKPMPQYPANYPANYFGKQ